VKEKAFW